jgi:hypothetical protein
MLIYLHRYNFSDPTVEAHAAPQQIGAGYRPRSRPVSVAIRLRDHRHFEDGSILTFKALRFDVFRFENDWI